MKTALLSILLLFSGLTSAQTDVTSPSLIDAIESFEREGSFTPRADCDRNIRRSKIPDINGTQIEISSISPEYAMELFQELASDPTVPFNYPDDGCYARAHYMSRKLEERGVITAKVFIEGRLRVATQNHPDGEVTWRYHVAPVVNVRRNGRDVLMVFDPSIFNRPVPMEEWVRIQTAHEGGQADHVYRTRRFVYGPNMDAYDMNVQEWRQEDVEDMTSTMRTYLPSSESRAAAARARTNSTPRTQP